MNDKVIVYARVKPNNKKYLEKMGLTTNNPVSVCLDAVLDASRLKRDLILKDKPIKALERAKVIRDKRVKKIKALGRLSKATV